MSDPLTIIQGDALSSLRTLPDESVQCCVTSPPYWGLRDYGVEPIVWGETVECEHDFIETRQYQDSPIRSGGEGVGFHDAETTKAQRWRVHGTCSICGAWRGCLGLEPTPELYVDHVVQIFRELKRVLRRDGTLWLNLGDSYATGGGAVGRCPGGGDQGERFLRAGMINTQPNRMPLPGLKPKDLIGIPWRVAFALRADGWYLRSDIIWSKPNPMPESVTDRPTKSHEYIFLLSKSERYYYNAGAIKEPGGLNSHGGGSADTERYYDHVHGNGSQKGLRVAIVPKKDKQRGHGRRHAGFNDRWDAMERAEQCSGVRNKRSVWTVATKPFADAHFATFPPDLIKPCILAGAEAGAVVIDPFAGSGTTGKVAIELGRKAILIEPKAEYVEMIKRRCQTTIGLPLAI